MKSRPLTVLPRQSSSATARSRLSATMLLTLIASFLTLPDAHARLVQHAGDITSAVERPIAPRGGVLALRLQQAANQTDWPTALSLTLADGEIVPGRVVWIADRQQAATNADDATHHWTHDPRGLTVYRSRPTHTQRATPILLARLPADGDGQIQFGRQTLEPFWRNVPEPGVPGAHTDNAARPAALHGRLLKRERAADRPDPDSPFEYWRWVLLADGLGKHPPPPPGEEEASRMVAEHIAQLWLIGLDRVADHRPELAATVREMLTRISEDRGESFAAWVSDVAATNELLEDILNMRRSGEQLVNHVSHWVERHDRLILWSEQAGLDQVALAVVNPGLTSVVATLSWNDDREKYPMAAEIEPGKLNRVTLDRPAMDFGRGNEHPLPPTDHIPSTEQLTIEASDRAYQMIFEQRFHSVTPPGMALPAFHAPLTLFRAQTGTVIDVPMARETFAHLRRIRGRWELFIECRRPVRPQRPRETEQSETTRSPDPGNLPDNWSDLHTMRHFEGVVVIIGGSGITATDGSANPDAVLVIPESGWYHLLEGEHDGTLQIHRSSRSDRWFVRLVLPDDWLKRFPGEVTRLGLLRHHHDLDEVHSAPYPMTPWRTEPGRINVDLSRWEDLPFPADAARGRE